MKIRRKLLSMILTAALVLSLMPAVTLTASATTYDAEYNINAGSVTIYKAGTYRIYGDGTSTGNSIWFYNAESSSAGAINITLENVNISPTSGISFCLDYNTTVNLTLVGINIIKGTDHYAGIKLGESSTLIITKASTGSLDVTGGNEGAGIGGDYASPCSQGTLVIEGGTVTAQGGKYAPGIGGGLTSSNNSTSGPVIITGGTVNATGGQYAAGIGIGGMDTYAIAGAGMVYISGGTVTANGGQLGGAGIGGGYYSASAGMIVITGGNVTAKGGSLGGAGIGGGGGYCSCAGYINISGGTVTATGGAYGAYAASYSGAGIGGGTYGDASVVTISGGDVTAIGGLGSVPGIGGGYSSQSGSGDGGLVTITGGTVTSLRKDGTPDIGAGRSTVTSAGEGSLYISGGSVNAGFNGTVYASNESTLPLYLTTVTGLPFSTAVTYSIDGGDSASCNTDGNGKLYLWLPESAETTVGITAGEITYEASGAISSDGTTELAADDPLEVTTESLSYGVMNTAYSLTLTAEGGTSPYTWSATGLPDGLTLDENTGIISGTLTETGAFSVSVTVTDDDGTVVTESLTLTVYSASSAVPRITVANGIAFTVTLYDTYGKYAGTTDTDYGTITGTVSGSDTILTGTLTGVPTGWTEVALTGGKVMFRSVTTPSASVDDPTFN